MVEILRMIESDVSYISTLRIDGKHICYILENKKLCIADGRWSLRLRKEGGFHQRYSRKFSFHKGMVEIIVPDREYILFHIGNKYTDSKGCPLTGSAASNVDVSASTRAYKKLYPLLVSDEGELLHDEVRIYGLY